MKGYQTVPIELPRVTWAAGSRDTQNLGKLAKQLQGRLAHIAAITWEVDVDPTFTTAPTLQGLNNVVSSLRIKDGDNQLFDGNFNYLRVFEILENNGRLVHPDPDTSSGSGNNFYFARTWTPGPANFAGAPSDFFLPVSALENAEIEYRFGALTDISADTTAAAVVIRTIVHVAFLDELRLPPIYERKAYSPNSADTNLTGRALYAFMAMLNSSAVDAISDGDFGEIKVTGAKGQLFAADAEVLTRMYHAENRTGQLTPVQGEPRAATDDNGKVVNSGTPTALAAATAAIQPVLWSPDGAMISKLVAEADNVLRVQWSGSQSSAVILVGRFLEQPPSAMTARAAAAVGQLKLSASPDGSKIKTLSKRPYNGPRALFMPVTLKVA